MANKKITPSTTNTPAPSVPAPSTPYQGYKPYTYVAPEPAAETIKEPAKEPVRIHREDPIPGSAVFKLYKNGTHSDNFTSEQAAWAFVAKTEGHEDAKRFSNKWRIVRPDGLTSVDV